MSFEDGYSSALENSKSTEEVGIGSFRLFARTRETTTYTSTIPTDVLEDGSTTSDDIIKDPITVVIEGVVGDVFIEEKSYPTVIPDDYSEVGEIIALVPDYGDAALQRIADIEDAARDALLTANRIANAGGQLYSLISGETSKSNKEQFQEYMEAVHESSEALEISTENRQYSNMGMSSLTIVSDNETGDMSFSASFQKIPLTELLYTEVTNYSDPSDAVSGKVSEPSNQGSQSPETNTEKSLLSSFLG